MLFLHFFCSLSRTALIGPGQIGIHPNASSNHYANSRANKRHGSRDCGPYSSALGCILGKV
jgi:hypothetical protein